jgi:exonuclease I
MRGNNYGPAIKMENDYVLTHEAQVMRGVIEDNIRKTAKIIKLTEEVRVQEQEIQMWKARIMKLADDRQKELIEHILAGGETEWESEEEE